MQQKKPRVQIRVGSDYHGLVIDGEMHYAIPKDKLDKAEEFWDTLNHLHTYLNPEASRAYWGYYGVPNNGWVYQCQDCDYLTMSKACRVTGKGKTCTHCSNTKWRRVFPRDSLVTVPDEHKDKVYVDVLDLEPGDVPNATSHLSRMQNQLADYRSKDQMLEEVADAMA